MSTANALQKALYETLLADAGVTDLVGAEIYDRPPETAGFPRITFGPAEEDEDGGDDLGVEVHAIQIDIWSRYQGGAKECKAISGAIKKALDGVEPDMGEYALSFWRIDGVRYLDDPDGATTHGVVRVEAHIET